MASGRRLDAVNRDVVFCHSCDYQWFRDEYGLQCPSCDGEVTEIVSLENDPRPAHADDLDDLDDSDDLDSSSPTSSVTYEEVFVYAPDPQTYRNGRREDGYHSHPHVHEHVDRNGFGYNHSTRTGQGATHYDTDPRETVDRFFTMASGAGMPVDRDLRERLQEASRSGRGYFEWDDEESRGSIRFYNPDGRPFRAGEQAPPGSDPFQSIFSSAFHDHEHQLTGEAASAAVRQGRGAARNMNELDGIYGDAVADERLDNVISALMDESPHSPTREETSPQALANLSRKTIREGSADGDTDCSICIDALKVGQVAVSLPCKHLFHEKCGLEWLKDHDTCPTGVEATDLRQSLVDGHSKTERRPNMDADQIALRRQEVVRMIDAIHRELADHHQTMDMPTGLQHQDPHGHQITARHTSIKQCGIFPYIMVTEAHLAVPRQCSATTRDLKDTAQGRRQALEWRW